MNGRERTHQSDGHGRLVRSGEPNPLKSRTLQGHFRHHQAGVRTRVGPWVAAQSEPVGKATFLTSNSQTRGGARERALARVARATAATLGAASAASPASAASMALS